MHTLCFVVIALGLASAQKREPAFIPYDPDAPTVDPSLNYRPVNSVKHPLVFTEAGGQPLLMAYLDEKAEDYATVQKTFNLAAADTKCLLKGGTFAMGGNNDVRARFIVGDIALPSATLFHPKREITYGGNWTQLGLRNWIYQELTGLSFVNNDPEYDKFVRSAGKTVVAFVESYCSYRATEFTDAIMEHRERTNTHLPAAISTNREVAELLGMEGGVGVIVMSERGKGKRTLFPQDRVNWVASELQSWMLGVMGPGAKFRRIHDEL